MAKQAALDTTELLKTYKRYKGTWNCSNKLEDFGRDQPEGHVARLLWTARHNGDLTMEDANFLLHIFPGAPDMWQAEDLIELVKELQKYCPDGEYSGGGASGWCDTDLPGSAYGLGGLIEEKKGDKAFAKHMKAHWKDLPTFWGTGVAFFLVLHDHMSYKELSDELVDTFLKAYIGSSGSWQARQFAEKLPDKVYKEALKRVLDNDPLLQLNYSEFADTISRFVKYYKPEEVIVLLDHVPNTNYIHDGVKALFPLGKKGIEFFEASFEGLEVPEQDWSKPWPYGFKITAYLALCAEEGHTPPASLDQTIQAMMGIYNGPWEGHDEDCEMTKKAFSSIPEDRLEAILLGMSPFPWKWIWLSSTPAIIEATFGAFCGLRAKVDYELERVVACLTGTGWASASQRALFAPIVEGLKPLFFEALKKGTKAGQRTNMMKLLAEEKDPAYIEAFIKGLNDTSKATRELAVGAMVSYGAETVREHIEAPLSAKRKDTRLAAALVLAHLPADEAVYELAQTYLKKEKTAEVKAMLETVAVPGERGEVSIDPKISEALEESVGAAWEEFKELGGDELVEVYWGWLANRSEGDSISPYSDSYTHWLALLKEYHEAASAPEAAIKVMTCLEYYNIDDYLKEIRPLFGARLDDGLAQIVRKGKVIRPPEAGGVRQSASRASWRSSLTRCTTNLLISRVRWWRSLMIVALPSARSLWRRSAGRSLRVLRSWLGLDTTDPKCGLLVLSSSAGSRARRCSKPSKRQGRARRTRPLSQPLMLPLRCSRAPHWISPPSQETRRARPSSTKSWARYLWPVSPLV